MRYTAEHKAEAHKKIVSSAAEQALEKYLSLAHVTTPEKGCLLPALSAEIGRASEEVKQGFEAEIQRLVGELAPTMGNMDKTWAVLALSVGGVLLARALKTEETRQVLLTARKEGAQTILRADR